MTKGTKPVSKTRILRRPEVEARTGLSRSAIYRRIADGVFPDSIPLGDGKAVGWIEAEIDAWIEDCIAQRDSPRPPPAMHAEVGAPAAPHSE
jgi:prophage regulatory protein